MLAFLLPERETKEMTADMKVLLINHFPLAGSGSGTYTKNLAVHLAERGHEVAILLPENTEEFDEVPGVRLRPVYFTPEDGSPAPDGALPFNFPCFTTHPRSTMTFGDLSSAEFSNYMEAFNRVLQEEIEANRPDVIHGQHVWVLSSLAADQSIPLVLTAHGTDLMGFDNWPELRDYAKHAMDACRAVISISKDNCVLLEERFPESRDKVVMMRNGYDPAVFYQEALDRREILGLYGIAKEEFKDKKIVIYAGKLTQMKAVDVLLQAVRLYEDRLPETLTLIVGDGEEREELEHLAEDLRLQSVRFLGNVDQQSLRRLYNVSDISVVPSRREAFGLVALEAMACGIPVVATNSGGLPDFVNDEVGVLVKPEDPQDLAEGIMNALMRADGPSFPEWRRIIANYVRTQYAQDTIIHELEELYQRSIQ